MGMLASKNRDESGHWLRNIIMPQELDRTGVLTLLASLYFFQFWGFQLDNFYVWPYDRNVVLLLILISAIGVILPRLFITTLINAFFYVTGYIVNSPILSNNQLCAVFVCAVIIAGAGVTLSRWLADKDTNIRRSTFEAISGPGRYILAIMYFYGIYHKINTDFLNPDVSCAVVLYRPLAMPFGLDEWTLGHYTAIYITFFVEAIAMILLFSPRYKRIGMIIGIPFHVVIGWTGYAYYKDFSTIVLVMYAMFLPRETVTNAVAAAGRLVGGTTTATIIGRIVLFALFGAYLLSVIPQQGSRGFLPTHDGFTWLFTIYAAAFYLMLVFFVPMRMSDPLTDVAIRPAWLTIFPVAFFINGASPYLGLKTESSIAMFSNLYTEKNETNHLIHGQLLFAADYQNDVVLPLSSSEERFNRRFVAPGQEIIRWEFDKAISRFPGIDVEFLHNGEQKTLDENWENTYLAANPLLRKFLIFKPLETSRPQECTH